jgi:uncharacterized protein YndB with AHSA1/START domain
MLSTETTPSGFVIDEANHTLRFERDIQASPAEVFDAWTQPAQLSQWWDPTGEKLAICEMDLRPGGSFRFVSPNHPDRPFTGIYEEIAPPSRLIFEANGARGKVMLEQLSEGTRMTVEIACRSSEHLEQFVAIGVAAGTSQTLDNLQAYCGQ